MQDQQIIVLLRTKKQEKAFQLLYKDLPKIRKMVLSNGGKKEDAEDLYQEALIVLYKKVTGTDFVLSSGLGTYLYSICRYMWKDELKRRNKTVQLKSEPGVDDAAHEFSEVIELESKFKLAEDVVRSLGNKCRELLKLFYFEQVSMRSIAAKLGFSSEKIAKNQKYKCLEQAKNKLKEMQSTGI